MKMIQHSTIFGKILYPKLPLIFPCAVQLEQPMTLIDTLFNTLIVTYNSAGEILNLLEDLQRLAPSHKVIVVDNASQDSTVEIVRAHFPEVTLLVNSTNLGYSRAVNQGIALCETEFVFLLNPDMRVLNPNFHAAMMDCVQESAAIAAVGPLQFVQDGSAYRLNFTWSYWAPRAFAVYLSHAFQFKHKPAAPIPVTFLNAGCLLLRKAAYLHVGKLNEKYFLYGEEPDLLLKFKRFNYECRLHAGVEVIHFRELSIKKLPARVRWLRKTQALFNISDALVRGVASLIVARFSHNR